MVNLRRESAGWTPKVFQGSSVIVTGAAAGIGAGTARQFAGHGADVEVVGINIVQAQKEGLPCP
jgi:NAD(P)-dependent dehydrogenase (short-subunit alcohol dehydrogenase family)